jgi:hypothetical protein
MSTLTQPRPTSADRPAEAPTTAVGRAMSRLSSVRVWVVVTAVYLAFAAAFFGSGAGFSIPHVQQVCGQAPPDMRFTSTAGEVHAFLEACGPAGREAYRALQLADLLYPLVFAVFLASSLALVLRLLAPTRRALMALTTAPFLAAVFDYLENACAWLALVAWPEPGVADGLLGLFSTAKTVTSWVAGTLLLVALAALALSRGRALLTRHRGRDAVDDGVRP